MNYQELQNLLDDYLKDPLFVPSDLRDVIEEFEYQLMKDHLKSHDASFKEGYDEGYKEGYDDRTEEEMDGKQ